MSKVLIVTDAWRPQVNGVVRTYERLAEELPRLGVETDFLTPNGFFSVPLPTYAEIRVAVPTLGTVDDRIRRSGADYIHIATEGPLGLAARYYCVRNRRAFTTSYHTRFPQYLSARLPVPVSWGERLETWFHSAASGTMVATPSLAHELQAMGIERTMLWTRGVDTNLFHPRNDRLFGTDGPIFAYMGRVAVEKNISAFLDLDLPGRKVVIGDGPQRAELEQRYPNVIFTGERTGEHLARSLASCDVFVFPSRTDTFGVAILEAMACGLPVAAYPVTGPLDIIEPGISGVIDDDLGRAARNALALSGDAARRRAMSFRWERCAELFMHNISTACQAHLIAGSENAGMRDPKIEARSSRAGPGQVRGVWGGTP